MNKQANRIPQAFIYYASCHNICPCADVTLSALSNVLCLLLPITVGSGMWKTC